MNIEYITERGDNKEKIQRKLRHDRFELDDLLLEPNQLLHLPKQTDEGLVLIEYYTKTGDTLKTISETFEIERSAIAYFNQLNQIFVCRGQTLSFLSAENQIQMDLLHDHSFH